MSQKSNMKPLFISVNVGAAGSAFVFYLQGLPLWLAIFSGLSSAIVMNFILCLYARRARARTADRADDSKT